MKDFQQLIDKTSKNKHVFGVSLSVSVGEEQWSGVSGDFQPGESFFIASTTKLFISALIFRLLSEGKVSLTDHVVDFFGKNELKELHVLKGVDSTDLITIENLLAHTSGLPDYFQDKSSKGKSIEDRLVNGEDLQWDFYQTLEWSRNLKSLFPPSKQGKAHYSDTNYQILGKIIEKIYDKDLNQVIQDEICIPLEMNATYLYSDPSDRLPKPMFYKSNELHIPRAMVSFWADGAIVSTSDDLMKFLKAFMNGYFFSVKQLQEMQKWNKIFFPLESGIGIHRFKIPWFFSPFKRFPSIIGHSGLSGAFAYYAPEKNIYLTGTINQIYKPSLSFQLMIKVLNQLI